MKFLLIPENNSLSHVAKCLALHDSLASRGHETLVAVTRRNAPFVEGAGAPCRILPDIQEEDEAGFPTVEWFRNPQKFLDVIEAETALLRSYRPDRVLGVFRFTLKASARLAGVPYDALMCGCMLERCSEVLGFEGGEPGAGEQRYYLDSFYRFAAAKASVALRKVGMEEIMDIRSMLEGDRTFLWDFPEFSPLPLQPETVHVGPLLWNGWTHDRVDVESFADGKRPLVVVTFGTCVTSAGAAERIVSILLDLGFRVVLAAGGQEELLSATTRDPRVTVCRFAPLQSILPLASLVVCHGGQMTVFEALLHQVPVLVLPFQPEQAHNALCVTRLGCGARLGRPQPFRGNPAVYIDAFFAMTDREVRETILRLLDSPSTATALKAASEAVGRYSGVAAVTALLEEG